MSWWADFGGWLGLGSAWTSLDWIIMFIVGPTLWITAGWGGLKFMKYWWLRQAREFQSRKVLS